MPELPTDFSEAQDFGALPVEDNPYACEVTDIDDVQESDAGNKYVSAEFTVFAPEEHRDRKVWRNLPLEGKGAGIYLDFARKVLGDMDLEPEEIAEIPTEEYIGRPVDVVIGNEEYPEGSGIIRNRVERLLIAE